MILSFIVGTLSQPHQDIQDSGSDFPDPLGALLKVESYIVKLIDLRIVSA